MRHLLLGTLALAACSLAPLSVAAAQEDPRPSDTRPGERPQLGVRIDENSQSFDPAQGLPVATVVSASTAAVMGIQAGDLLKTLNGKPLRSVQDLQTILATIKVGDPMTVDLQRGADIRQLSGSMLARPGVPSIEQQLREMREQTAEIRQAAGMNRQPTLAEVLQQLAQIEQNLPKAVEEFKKQYPNGEFTISIKIDIVSDKTAKSPVELVPPPGAPASGAPAPTGAPAPAGTPAPGPEAKVVPAPEAKPAPQAKPAPAAKPAP